MRTASVSRVKPNRAESRAPWVWTTMPPFLAAAVQLCAGSDKIANLETAERLVAAAAGRVIFAGWKNNGGGYQVWISHGGGLSTTYNHMSAVMVGTGQYVSRGQQVGRIGMTGDATGPNLHFEVWIGAVWSTGYRVNPLKYL